jgi:hypothetical protein
LDRGYEDCCHLLVDTRGRVGRAVHKKRGVPRPGWGPSCVGPGRSGAVGQGVAGAGVSCSLLLLLLLFTPEGLLGHTQGTGEGADRALPQLSGLRMMGSSLLMSRYPTTKSTCTASIPIAPTTTIFICSPSLPKCAINPLCCYTARAIYHMCIDLHCYAGVRVP